MLIRSHFNRAAGQLVCKLQVFYSLFGIVELGLAARGWTELLSGNMVSTIVVAVNTVGLLVEGTLHTSGTTAATPARPRVGMLPVLLVVVRPLLRQRSRYCCVEKNTHTSPSLTGRQGLTEHVCKNSGSLSHKRRNVWACVRKTCENRIDGLVSV